MTATSVSWSPSRSPARVVRSSVLARRLGLGRSAALFGALAFATFTVVALQTPTALNDLVVASLLVVCVIFALGVDACRAGLCATALALAVGTKGTAVFALPVLVVFVLASQPLSRWWSRPRQERSVSPRGPSGSR